MREPNFLLIVLEAYQYYDYIQYLTCLISQRVGPIEIINGIGTPIAIVFDTIIRVHTFFIITPLIATPSTSVAKGVDTLTGAPTLSNITFMMSSYRSNTYRNEIEG